ncbi:MAG: hypothetical protein GXX84_03610 [Acidobacteria bacterium]|nr:hypothetical protein [Acidobacteriota bacterium]
MKTRRSLLKPAGAGVLIFLGFILPAVIGAEQNAWRDEARFEIFVNGEEIGEERFSIRASGDSVTSSSTLSFKTPRSGQSVRIETQLAANARFVPKNYEVRTDINGKKGIVKGVFAPGEASFEYLAAGKPTKSGLLVGDEYLVLDTNVFHHFVFVGRLFDLGNKENAQSVEVVIPQELENGILRIREVGIEKIRVDGKNRELHHLSADSGTVQIDLWIDDKNVLYKIALPAKGLEIVRNS